jgi:hypothetical protein
MRRSVALQWVGGVAVVLVLAACGRASAAKGEGDPFARLYAHTDRMIAILEDNTQDPDQALRALAAYRQENGAEIEALKAEVGRLMQQDPMKTAAASSAYGLRSMKLEGLVAEVTSRRKAR